MAPPLKSPGPLVKKDIKNALQNFALRNVHSAFTPLINKFSLLITVINTALVFYHHYMDENQ
jgi:hypothetical protein